MAISLEQLDFILDQLSMLSDLEHKKMFGGVGFYKEGVMFGMLAGSTFRMRVDESNQAMYESAGMKPYQNDKKKKGMPYWEVPVAVLEDQDQLKVWAEQALEVAVKHKK